MVAMAAHIAIFHTMFNVINTLIFLPFVKQIACEKIGDHAYSVAEMLGNTH